MVNGCMVVRLIWFLVGFRTHLKSMHFYFSIMGEYLKSTPRDFC